MDIVLIKIAWLFMLLLVIATFAQQEQEQQQQNGLSKETSSTSSFAEPLSNVPDPTSSKSGLQGEFQKAKLGLDAFKVGKQQADHIKDKIPNVGYS
ncbi:hypothetical protein INT45_013732 [Circinella minor]|uniref:Uncharacterized protein n=1 Tax=Circinella minor TaxID=1195481 RepID=A0A8H7VJZ3_9FUNG|nr:hypothetical protein INT45_013732 [Circinella minor]